MSDLPVSSFPAATPKEPDLLYLVQNNSGIYASKKMTVANMDDAVRHATRFAGADAGLQIQAAINDLPSTGGTIDARGLEGSQTIGTTITIDKPVTLIVGAGTFSGAASPMINVTTTVSATIKGAGIDITKFMPSAGTAIAVSPTSSIPIEIAGLTIDMSNAASQKAMSLNNVTGGLIHNIKINRGTYGIDISNTGISFFEDIFVYNNSTAGIRLLGDGGQEDYFRNVWIVNNNAAVTQTDGFLVSRTTTADTGGLYMDRVFIVQNAAGGNMTNGLHFVSTAGSPTILFAELSNIVVDGIKGGASILWDNVNRIDLHGGSITNAALLASAFPAIHLKNTSQIDIFSTLMASNWADLKFEGATDMISVTNSKLFGSGPVAVGHLYVTGGASPSNLRIWNNPYDTTTTYTNNATALKAASTIYEDHGSLEILGYLRLRNDTAFQAYNASGVPLGLLKVDGSNNNVYAVQGGHDHVWCSDQFATEVMRLSGASSQLTVSSSINTIGGVFTQGGNQVIGPRSAAVADVTGAAGGTYTAAEQTMLNSLKDQLNALLNRIRTHGLIAP